MIIASLTSGPSESDDWQALGVGIAGVAGPSGRVLRTSGPSESEGWQALGVGPQR